MYDMNYLVFKNTNPQAIAMFIKLDDAMNYIRNAHKHTDEAIYLMNVKSGAVIYTYYGEEDD